MLKVQRTDRAGSRIKYIDMKTIADLAKEVDINWVIELCREPGARLDYMQEKITLKYNRLTANEARNLILFIALCDASIIAVKELHKN